MNKSGTGANVGGSSILVIFVLLAITTFATLAMVSATTSFRLAAQVADAGAQFYEADGWAEDILADISRVLRGLEPAGDHGDRQPHVDNILRSARRISEMPDGYELSYIINYSHNLLNDSHMQLSVTLFIHGDSFEVRAWTARPVYDPALYGGVFEFMP